MVAALKDDRVAIAGSRGILLFTDSGNALETVFVAGYLAQPETEDAVAVLDMGADPEGESLFALMETSDGGRALVAWDADDLAALTGAQICVDHKADVPAGECNPLDAGECVAMCSTIQAGIDNAPTGATIHVAPGEYHENLVVGYRAMDLIATEPGSVHVVADRPEPVLSAYYNGEPGLLVDGFVFEGGRGLSIPELGPGTTFGGGVAMVWAAVTLKRTAVMDNQATGGGGVAAVLSRRLTLLNVGLLGNDADYGGGLAVLGAGIYHYLITPPFD